MTRVATASIRSPRPAQPQIGRPASIARRVIATPAMFRRGDGELMISLPMAALLLLAMIPAAAIAMALLSLLIIGEVAL